VDPVTNRRVVPDGSSQYTDKSRSNSLMAVYELQQAGYTNLYHLQGAGSHVPSECRTTRTLASA